MIPLYRFEVKRMIRASWLFSFGTALMIFLSMSFYPDIANYLDGLGAFFETGSMQQIFKLFNINLFEMSSILGFYATYCTMWIILIGSVYFAYLTARALTEDCLNGYYEALLSLPISAVSLWWTKVLAVLTAFALYALIVGGSGFLSLHTFGVGAPKMIQPSAYDALVTEAMIAHQAEIVPLLALTDSDFTNYTQGLLLEQFTSNEAALSESNIDVTRIVDVVGDRINDPVSLFDDMMADPETYLALFGITDMTGEAFIEAVAEEKVNYEVMKTAFFDPNQCFSTFYTATPEFFLNLILTRGLEDAVDEYTGGILSDAAAFSPYTYRGYLTLHANMMFTLLANVMIAAGIATLAGNRESATARTLGAIFALYFINNLSALMPSLDALKWLSPFGYFPVEAGQFGSGGHLAVLAIVIMLIEALAIRRLIVSDPI